VVNTRRKFSICRIFIKLTIEMIFLLFLFQTTMISVDNLLKAVDRSQLTREFDGILEYDHKQRIQLRIVSVKDLHIK
jgi:cell division protein FtsB